MLVATYLVALLVAFVGWPKWRRIVNSEVESTRSRCWLVTAYWLLAATLLGDLLSSLAILDNAWPQARLRTLMTLAFGTLAQLALFALVITPIVMRGKSQQYSFTRALIIMEGFAFISIIMLAVGLICLLRYRNGL